PGQVRVPWPVAFDKTLGTNVPVAVLVLLASAAALVGGVLWSRGADEQAPGFPVTYAPPAGFGPAQTVYVARETAGEHALTATLLHQAATGLTRLEHRSDDSWLVTGT